MSEFNILDAFLELDKIPDEAVSGMIKKKKMHEGTSVSIHAPASELEDAKKVLQTPSQEKTEIEVIDADADTVEHLKTKSDYIGDFLLKCSRCHKIHFIAGDKLVADEEDPELYNVDDECPNCHEAGAGFALAGQVGKVEKDEPAEELPTIENDDKEASIAFDNEEEAAEEEEAENNIGPESSEEPEVDAFVDEPEDDGMSVDQADDSDDMDFETPSLEPDEDEEKEDEKKQNEALDEALFSRNAKEAWLMNKVIQALGDEDAYYGSGWLYVWVDGCDEEACKAYFDDDDSFRDLEELFNSIYTEYHEDGLDNPDEETLAFAKKKDVELGLPEVKVHVYEEKENIREAFGYDSLEDFLALIQDAENINTIIIKNTEGTKLYEGNFENLYDTELLDKAFQGFNSVEGIATFNVDSNELHGTKLIDVLKFFTDDESKKISIAENDNEVFSGNKEDAIKEYGEAGLLSIQIPDRIEIVVDAVAENNIGPESSDVEESLFEAICKANNLRAYRADHIGSEEYFLKESLDAREELDQLYEQYVVGNEALERKFKTELNYLDAVDEARIKLYGDALEEKLISKSSSDMLNRGGEAIDQALATAGVKAQVATSNTNPEQSILIAVEDDDSRRRAHQIIDKTLDDMNWEPEINKDVDEGQIKGIQIGNIKATAVIGAKNESYKTRKELSEAIDRLKAAGVKYTVSRSIKEGYRYDVTINEGTADYDFQELVKVAAKCGLNTIEDIDKYAEEHNVDGKDLYTLLKGEADKIDLKKSHAAKPDGDKEAAFAKAKEVADNSGKDVVYGYDTFKNPEKFFEVGPEIYDGDDNAFRQKYGANVIYVAHPAEKEPIDEAKKPNLYDKLVAMKAEIENNVEEDLNEAKKDELPPDPTAIKIETQQAINNLASEQIGTAQEVSEVIQDLSEKPIEHKDEIISDLEAIKDAALDSVEALNATATKITFTRRNHAIAPAEEPAVESLNEEEISNPDDSTNDDRDAHATEWEEEQRVLSEAPCSYAVKVGDKYLDKDKNLVDIDAAEVFETVEAADEFASDMDCEIAEISCDEFDAEKFENEVNEYFNEAYEDTTVFTATCCEELDDTILIHGIVRMNESESDITFTLKPQLNESKNNTQAYLVTNDLSDEKFEFEV